MKHVEMSRWLAIAPLSLTMMWQHHAGAASDPRPAILVIGASYANGATPFNDALNAPLGGICVNFGSYLSVGNALVRDAQLDGFVINEAQAGATTFDRPACGITGCGPAAWQGYPTQLSKAMSRVAIPDPANPGQILCYNADHVIISMPNDCLHSDAFGLPQSQTAPCDLLALDAVVTRLLSVGQTAISHGITPIFEAYPEWANLDFPLMQSLFGLAWTIDQTSYNYLRSQHLSRVVSELPAGILVDPWQNFVHIGDGLHPSPATAMAAGRDYAQTILTNRVR